MYINHVRRIGDSLREEENFLEIEIISLISIILSYKKIPNALTNYLLTL